MIEGWIQLWYIVRTFENVTMYPKYNNKETGKIWVKIFDFTNQETRFSSHKEY
jgi:hypothetical protein